jgi:hypothetical protein
MQHARGKESDPGGRDGGSSIVGMEKDASDAAKMFCIPLHDSKIIVNINIKLG